MFDIGFWEMAMIAVVGLVIQGPKQMTATVRTALNGINKARQMSAQLSQQLSSELKSIEDKVEEKPTRN